MFIAKLKRVQQDNPLDGFRSNTMTIRGENTAVIVAGGTGLVGSQLIEQILPHEAISTLYALTRRQITVNIPQAIKLVNLIEPDLLISDWPDERARPTVGFICHYLKCKGQMERALMNMGFEQLVIVRPGPLKGQRHASRSDEKWLQRLMRPFIPFMRGKLRNYTPIIVFLHLIHRKWKFCIKTKWLNCSNNTAKHGNSLPARAHNGLIHASFER